MRLSLSEPMPQLAGLIMDTAVLTQQLAFMTIPSLRAKHECCSHTLVSPKSSEYSLQRRNGGLVRCGFVKY